MDVLEIVGEIEEIIDVAKPAFLSNKVSVNKEEVMELLADLRVKLPDEIKQATWIKEERERILNEARMDADKVINDAKVELSKLLSQEQITIEAKKLAAEMVAEAKNQSKQITLGSIDYTDKLLINTQDSLKNMIDTLNENRRQLMEMAADVKRNNE